MLIATSLNVVPNDDPETAAVIPRLARAGFEGVDFCFPAVTKVVDWDREASWRPFIDGLAEAAAASKLAWVQAHGPMFNMFGEAEHDAKNRAWCRTCIRACGILGVPWMVLHPDVFPGAFDAAHKQALLERNAAFFRSLLPDCEKHGVGIAIENIFDEAGMHGGRNCPRFFACTPDEQCALIDHLDHPLVGACWDTGHARLMKLDQRAALTALGARLKAVHIQENDGKGDDHLMPFANGRNGVDWKAVTDGLAAAKYAGAFTFEIHHGVRAVPEALIDRAYETAVLIGRHLVRQIEAA